jgi:hypothetical protein
MKILKYLALILLTENFFAFAFHIALPLDQSTVPRSRCQSVQKYQLSYARQPRKARSAWRCEEMRGKGNFEKEMCRNLEMSFRYVWLRLFTTGADENYIIALKDFVKNTVAAYDAGYSLPALILELGRNEIETGDPNVDKTVRLTDQERQTREVWLVLIYLTLDRLNYKSSGLKPAKPSDTLGLGTLVDSTCEALKAGFSLEGLKLELSLRETVKPLTPAQLSLRSQWTRIVFLTSEVIKFQSA